MKYTWRHAKMLTVWMGLSLSCLSSAYAASVKSIGRSVDVEVEGVNAKQRTIFCSSSDRPKIQKIDGQRAWCVVGNQSLCAVDKLTVAKSACSSANLTQAKAADEGKVGDRDSSPIEQNNNRAERAMSETEARKAVLTNELNQINKGLNQIKLRIEQLDIRIAELSRQREQP